MEAGDIFGDSATSWNREAFDQSVRGICSVLLSLKKKPVIRYQGASAMAAELANEVQASRHDLMMEDWKINADTCYYRNKSSEKDNCSILGDLIPHLYF